MTAPSASPQTIAYLTSVYPRASDSFIRGEIRALRQLGWTVHTHAVRRPGPDQLVSDDIRQEHAATFYLLADGLMGQVVSLLAGWAALFLHHPARILRAKRLAWRCGWPGLKGHLWPLAYLAQAALLSRRLQRQGAVHLHNHIGENSAAVAMLAATLANIPYSLTIHGPYEFDAPARLALRAKIQHAKFVAAISDFTRAQLCRWARPEDWSKIQVVHCAVALEFLDQGQPPRQFAALPADPALVCVGRLCPEKGQLVLIQALAQLLKQGARIPLTLVGDGPSRPDIEAAIARAGLTSQVKVVGWCAAAQVRQYLEQSTALVLPSFAEGLPVVIMEALALGRPVISTYIAAIPELVIPGENGWLVPAGSPEKLAATLTELLHTPRPQLAAMGQAGAARVQTRHHPITEATKLAQSITQ